MHRLVIPVALVLATGFPPTVESKEQTAFPERADMGDASLPKNGSISDVLACAGANEVFWVTAMKENPRNPEAHEAKRKAGWYSAVALWVFNVESSAVIEAVEDAFSKYTRADVIRTARRCRKAPNSWRE